MKIYLQTFNSRRFLLIGGLVLSLFYAGIVALLWHIKPDHPAMFVVMPLYLIFAICTILPFFFRNFLYVITAGMAFTAFVCPIVMCLIAMVLTTGNDSRFVVLLPYAALAFNLVVTGLEYRGIDFDKLPTKVTRKPFRSAGDGGLFFNPHASVLFLSPWRNDDSFFFAGRIRRLQQLLVVVLFIYMMWLFAAKVQTDNATGVAPAFGVMLSLAAFVMQPYVLQHMIKLRLVLLKGKGRI